MDDSRRARMAQLLSQMGGMEGMAGMPGFGGGGMGGSSGARQQISAIAAKIKTGDDSEQYMGLTEFCETLNMATGDILRAINPEDFVAPIVSCLQKDYNPEIVLLAARSLTYLVDAVPVTARVVASTPNGISSLCDKLRNIIDIDVAEQSLNCLTKLSGEIPGAILQQDGLGALLGFIDFFSMNVQRNALKSVSQICKRVDSATFASVRSVLPQLHNYVQHEDSQMQEHALQSILRIIHGVQTDEAQVQETLGELAPTCIEVLDKKAMDGCFTNALKIVGAVIHFSPKATQMMLEFGLIFTLQGLLETQTQHGAGGAGGASPGRSPQPAPKSPPTQGAEMMALPAADQSPGGNQASPEHTTPPSANRNLAAQSKTMSTEHTVETVGMLTKLLPAVRDDFMPYWSPSGMRFRSSSKSHRTGYRAHETLRRRLERMAEGEEGSEMDEHEEDEEDEEEEEEETQEEVTARILELDEAKKIRLRENKDKHGRCVVGNHSCDVCGAGSLQLEDWYRCNELPDYDTCSRCLLHTGVQYSAKNPTHTFTAMSKVIAVPTAKPQFNLSAPCPRATMFAESPHLLSLVCETVGPIVRLAQNAENASVRVYSLDFVSRCVAACTSEQLRTLLLDVSLCDMLVTCFEVADGNLTLLPPLVFSCDTLLQKLRDPYHSLFVREGVVHAMTKLGSGSSAEVKQSGNAKVEVLCATEEGWNQLLALRASTILTTFQDESSGGTMTLLRSLAADFAASSSEDWTATLDRFMQAYDGAQGISTFELVSSGVIHEVVASLKKHPHPVLAVADLFRVMSRREDSVVFAAGGDNSPGPQASVTPLTKLVRQLQTVIGQYENFPPGGGLKQVSSQIRLKLTPEGPVPGVTTGDGPASSLGDGGNKAKERKPKELAALSATVDIDPLANIGAVADFIATRLLPEARKAKGGGGSPTTRAPPPGGEADDDGDNVEEILPELTGGTANTKKGPKHDATVPTTTQLYLRFGDQALPHRLSMAQVLRKYVEPLKKKGTEKKKAPANPGIPQSLHEALMMASVDCEEVPLVYSFQPFDESIIKPAEALTSPSGKNKGGVVVNMKALTQGGLAVHATITKTPALSCAADLPVPSIVQDCLVFLNALHRASVNWSTLAQYALASGLSEMHLGMTRSQPVHQDEFLSSKLNSKLLKQLCNTGLVGQLEETWCVRLVADCPFLFPATTRSFVFDVVYHGAARALNKLRDYAQSTGVPESAQPRPHRLPRIKMRVGRNPDEILSYAKRIDELHSQSRCVFEMEFYGEEGSGLGPTLEFYTLVGKALCTRETGLWRMADDDEQSGDSFQTTLGLFPQPLPQGSPKLDQAVKNFKFLGRILARSVLDRRLLNLRLSRPLLKMLRGTDAMVLDDVAEISRSLYEVLFAMQQGSVPGGLEMQEGATVGSITIGNQKKPVRVEDLCLNFVLSGTSEEEISLCDGGVDKDVTYSNMGDYVEKTVQTLLKSGVEKQVAAMREGFDEIIPIRSLKVLELEDLATLFCGHEAKVTVEDLEAHTKADHGFVASSPTIKMFFEVLAEMSLEEQHMFFGFLTGSPRLPVGGLASLRPRFTIVRKTVAASNGPGAPPPVSEQSQLPSAMTCQNFLKLPAYDTKEQLKTKLKMAVEEGRSGFNFT